MKRKTKIILPSLLIAGILIPSFTAAQSSSELSVNIVPVLSVRVVKDNANITELNLNATPTSTGTFVKDDLSVLVSTSNETGYTLTFSDQDEDNAMHHTDPTITTTLSSITTNADEDTFSINSWGYSLGDITDPTQVFSPIPLLTSAATIKTTTAPTVEDQTNVTFATKVDTSIPAGTYQDTVVFSVTANYVPQNPLDSISTMQEMTPAICTESTIGDEAILTDARDGNTYAVRKMEDGKCWMTQNLRIGTTTTGANATNNITLTSADSDVSSNFTIQISAIQNSGSTSWENPVNAVHVYNNGNAWISPTSSGSAATVNTTGAPPSQSQYIGNYYNWYTATAGTGTASISSGNATSSICPKGWKLPTGGANSDFTGLTSAIVGVNNNTDSVPDKTFAMQSAPNHFVLSGYYGSGVNSQGGYSAWWSRTARSSANSYYLLLGITIVWPQSNVSKYHGRSVRCLAR